MASDEQLHTNVESTVHLLEQILANRTLLSSLEPDLRKRLLIAAGRVSRPERLEVMKLAKLYRRGRKKKARDEDRQITAQTIIREVRQSPVYIPPDQQKQLAQTTTEERRLNKPRNCYVCKTPYDSLHFFYDSMCPECGNFNYEKRFQLAPLDGKTALITGARIKIGYQAALMMLRAGAKVIVTTRFPRDAASRFAREKDYSDWVHRLEVHGLDLRHSPSVELFTHRLVQTESRLDILINNAAQTVRRPPGFYRHLLQLEQQPFAQIPQNIQHPLRAFESWKTESLPPAELESPDSVQPGWVNNLVERGAAIGLQASALLSQIGDVENDRAEYFPEGKTDADLQQIDLRQMNSWRMKLADVGTPELLEVQLVNTIAPFILCAKLKPLMLRQPNRDKHIVNVSAMEGKFARYTKTDKHPHTNMAKAALNMMTLTSAPDYAQDGIYMNAVDTGWVTDEDPAHLSERKQREHDFQPPLDIVDGAARICDPFFHGLLTGKHVWGKFLKDYKPTEW
jgi:NAD(P)-dependent dehydrogenase (short-subunit alcohol dehydrogenase family)